MYVNVACDHILLPQTYISSFYLIRIIAVDRGLNPLFNSSVFYDILSISLHFIRIVIQGPLIFYKPLPNCSDSYAADISDMKKMLISIG